MSKDVNVENMYEGKNIGIILNKTKLENFVIQEFVLDENINEHQKLEIQLEMDDEQRKNLERIIEKEDVGIEIELANVDKDVKRKVFSGIVDYFEILDYGIYLLLILFLGCYW